MYYKPTSEEKCGLRYIRPKADFLHAAHGDHPGAVHAHELRRKGLQMENGLLADANAMLVMRRPLRHLCDTRRRRWR